MPDRLITGTELARRYAEGAARGINASLYDLMGEAQRRAPLLLGGLRESAEVKEATPDELEGVVSFNKVYAAAQHEGWAIQHRLPEHPGAGPTLFQLSMHIGHRRVGLINVVYWHVERYTTPGTGKKYLEHPLLEMIPRYEAVIAASAEAALHGA